MSYQRVDNTPPKSTRVRSNPMSNSPETNLIEVNNSSILGKYHLEIPHDLQPLHKRACLGYPGINPQNPDQVENILNAEKLRTGFFEKYLFKNETAQGSDLMYEHFTDRSKLINMGNFLCKAILKQRNDDYFFCGASSPSIDKVSLNEEARTNWLNVFADPNRSLDSLPHNVPHGLRVEKLIRQLEEHNCTVSHAVWVIRLVVLSDQKQKKSTPNASTQDWTSQFIRVLERTMVELLKSSHAEEPSLEKYLKQWDYCTKLSRALYAQDLLDKKSFLRWIVDIVSVSTSKCILMIPIMMTFLPDLFQSRILCLMMLRSIIPHYEQTLSPADDTSLISAFPSFCRGIIELAMLQAPDVLVAPYLSYPSIITNWERHIATPNYPYKEAIYRVLGINPTPEKIAELAHLITSRNRRFTDCPIFQEVSSPPSTELLNPFEGLGPVSLSSDFIDIVKHVFKSIKSTHTEQIYSIISNLINWVIRHGAKDPELKYLVSAIIKIWTNAKTEAATPQSNESSSLNTSSPRKDAIESSLLRFLDQGIDHEKANDDVLDLYSQLTRQGTFSYLRYLRRAIARGYLNPSFTPSAYRHLSYLSNLPAYAADPAATHHRKASLLPPGLTPAHDFDQEQALLDTIINRLIEKLPAILGPPSPSLASQIAPTADDPVAHSPLLSPWDEDLRLMIQSASRYIRGEVVTYLMEGTMNYIIKDVKIGEDNWRVISKPGTALINVREFSLIATIFEICQEFGALLELCLWILVHTEERTLVPILVDVFCRYQSFLIANGFAGAVTAGLWKKHREFKTSVNHLDKTTMLYLLHLANMNAPGSNPSMKSEIESCFQSLVPLRMHNGMSSGSGSTDIGEYVAELYDLPSDSSTLRSRSASLCMRYRNIPGWWSKLFASSTQLILHQVTSGCEINGNKLVQIVRNYSDLFRFLGDFSLEPSCALQEWIRPLLLNTPPSSSSPIGSEKMQWFMVYLSFLVSRSICPLNSILKIALNSIELTVRSCLQQSTSSYGHIGFQNDHVFLLVYLLLMYDGSQKNIYDNIQLGSQDVFLLDQMRCTVFNSIESLDIPFCLLYQFSLLESLLPPQHPFSDTLYTLSRNLVSMHWFMKFGKQSTVEIYARYMADGGTPLKALPLSLSITTSPEPIQISDEVHKKLNTKLMNWFLIILGEEIESTSIHFTSAFRPSSTENVHESSEPFNVDGFEKDLVLINLYLERLVCSTSCSQRSEEIASYTRNFFHHWIANPQLPDRVLIQAFEGIPSALWPRFLTYGENLLSGSPDTAMREFPNFVTHLKSNLVPVGVPGLHKNVYNGHVIPRFRIVIQTLLICNKDSCSDESFSQVWAQAKFQFGTHLLNELVCFSTSCEIFSIMMHANCTYSQAQKYFGISGGIYEAAFQAINSESNEKEGIDIELIREAIQIRLEILIPLISSLVSQSESSTLLNWIEAIFNIMTSPLSMTSSQLFDLVLDFFSYFMGELPKDAKGEVFALLRNIQLRLPSDILADPRILRLFPFEAKSSFPCELRNSTAAPSKESPTENMAEQTTGSKSQSNSNTSKPTNFNPWEWDKYLVRDSIAVPLSHFMPRSLSSLAQSTLNTNSDTGPLIEAYQLEPPASLPSTPMSSTASSLPRISSTTVHSRSKFATTTRLAASPLMSFRSTLSPLAALQNSLHLLSSAPPKQPSSSDSKSSKL